MEPLPKLPGNSFVDPTLSRFHRSQSLGYKNGYALPMQPTAGIGGKAINFNQLSEAELDELANYNPTLTYGQARQAPPEDFVPAHVAWDKKVMKFFGYFKNTVHESPDEHFRVRPIELFYFLEDDSMAVVEPHVENSGLPQGKLIKRQRLPKNDVGDHWHWRDLNVGMNVTFYGKVFHLHDCDKWTREFLESEGLDVNLPEDCPTDPYADKRKEASALRTFKTTSDFDKLRQFLEMDRKVLRFYAVWDDRDSMFGELRKFIIHYYLNNDTLEIREVHSANDGRDPFPILIARQKVPKNRDNVDPTFPRVVMELSAQEIQDYFTPKDFDIGKTVEIERRRFFIYDCDNFTKAFYWKNFNKTDFTPVDVETLKNNPPTMEIAPFNGYGSLEDSLQSCLTLIPQPPKKDFIKMLENDGHVLRFEATLDSPKPDDKGRRFIISYQLSDDMVTIYEPPVRNSGIIGGKFLERTRVSKPGCTPDAPKFYGPADFYIGGVIVVYSHRFVIINADRFVLTYMEEHANQFPGSTIQTLREKLGSIPASYGASKSYGPGELDAMVYEVKSQLKKIDITAANRKDRMFLGTELDRVGYITKANLKDMCRQRNLPCDDAIVEKLAQQIGQDPDHITLEEFRNFIESA